MITDEGSLPEYNPVTENTRVSRLVAPQFWRALLDYGSWSAQAGCFCDTFSKHPLIPRLGLLRALVLIPLPVHHRHLGPGLVYNFQTVSNICFDVGSRSTFWPIASPRYVGRRTQNRPRYIWLDRIPLLKTSVPATLCSLGLRVPIPVGLWDVCPTSNRNEPGDL